MVLVQVNAAIREWSLDSLITAIGIFAKSTYSVSLYYGQEVKILRFCWPKYALWILCVIVAFAIIYIYKCFNFSSLLIASTHLGITWPNDIVWLTLTIFFLPVAIVKRRSNQHMLWNQITIVPVLNILDSFQACNLWTRIACICFNQILSNGWWYITWIAAWM